MEVEEFANEMTKACQEAADQEKGLLLAGAGRSEEEEEIDRDTQMDLLSSYSNGLDISAELMLEMCGFYEQSVEEECKAKKPLFQFLAHRIHSLMTTSDELSSQLHWMINHPTDPLAQAAIRGAHTDFVKALRNIQTCSRLVINEPLASETTDHTHKELTRAVERTSVVMEAIHELLQKSDADASSSNATPGSQPESPMQNRKAELVQKISAFGNSFMMHKQIPNGLFQLNQATQLVIDAVDDIFCQDIRYGDVECDKKISNVYNSLLQLAFDIMDPQLQTNTLESVENFMKRWGFQPADMTEVTDLTDLTETAHDSDDFDDTESESVLSYTDSPNPARRMRSMESVSRVESGDEGHFSASSLRASNTPPRGSVESVGLQSSPSKLSTGAQEEPISPRRTAPPRPPRRPDSTSPISSPRSANECESDGAISPHANDGDNNSNNPPTKPVRRLMQHTSSGKRTTSTPPPVIKQREREKSSVAMRSSAGSVYIPASQQVERKALPHGTPIPVAVAVASPSSKSRKKRSTGSDGRLKDSRSSRVRDREKERERKAKAKKEKRRERRTGVASRITSAIAFNDPPKEVDKDKKHIARPHHLPFSEDFPLLAPNSEQPIEDVLETQFRLSGGDMEHMKDLTKEIIGKLRNNQGQALDEHLDMISDEKAVPMHVELMVSATLLKESSNTLMCLLRARYGLRKNAGDIGEMSLRELLATDDYDCGSTSCNNNTNEESISRASAARSSRRTALNDQSLISEMKEQIKAASKDLCYRVTQFLEIVRYMYQKIATARGLTRLVLVDLKKRAFNSSVNRQKVRGIANFDSATRMLACKSLNADALSGLYRLRSYLEMLNSVTNDLCSLAMGVNDMYDPHSSRISVEAEIIQICAASGNVLDQLAQVTELLDTRDALIKEVIAKGGKRQSIRLANNDDVHFWAEWRQTGQQYISRIANDTDGVEKEGGVASLNQLIGRLTNSTVFSRQISIAFIRTLSSFAGPSVVMRKLYQRYSLPNDWTMEPAKVVQTRVGIFLEAWINFEKAHVGELIPVLKDFAEQFEKDGHKLVAEKIRNALEKVFSAMRAEDVNIRLSGNMLQSPVTDEIASPFQIFLNFDLRTLAEQITLSDFEVYKNIRATELLQLAWSKPELHHRAPNIRNIIHRANQLSTFVSTMIVAQETAVERAHVMERFITLAHYLRDLGCFSSLMALLSSLQSSYVQRMTATVSMVNQSKFEELEELRALMSTQKSWKAYRGALEMTCPAVPFIGVWLSDLTFLEDGNPDFIDGKINFAKRCKMSNIITRMEDFQTDPYPFKPMPALKKYFDHQIFLSSDLLYKLSLFREPRTSKSSKKKSGNP